MCRSRHKIFKICTGECVCVRNVYMLSTRARATAADKNNSDTRRMRSRRLRLTVVAVRKRESDKDTESVVQHVTHCFFEFNRRLFFLLGALRVDCDSSVHVFDPVRQAQWHYFFCPFAVCPSSFALTIKRNGTIEWANEKANVQSRTQQSTPSSRLRAHFPKGIKQS